MSIDTKALIAATPATVALVRRELDKSRESQRGECSIPKAVKVDCAMVERLCRIAEKQADRLAALEAENGRLKPAEQHDPLAVSDHCGECSEPEPECVCGEQPDERESLPLTFTQGVLCSLSILDRYGDSIAYREVADPHDLNQLWEEADEFDREHLARHGYRPTPAAQESGDASD